MKAFTLTLSFVVCLGVGWILGHRSYRVASLAYLAEVESAELYRLNGDTVPEEKVGTVDFSGIAPVFAAATWRSGNRPIHQEEFALVLSDGTRIRGYAPGYCFLVDGVPGYFVVAEADCGQVTEFLKTVLDDEFQLEER